MTSSVSIINKGSGCVVKYSEDSRKYNELLRREFGIYNALKMSGLNILNLDPASTDQMLIFTEIGMTLKNWCHTLDFRLPGHCSKFLTMMIQVLNELKKLHIFGFTHGDIRPANILVIKEEGKHNTQKACLIDFDYSHRIGTSLDSVFGTKEFMAEKLIFMDTVNEFRLEYKEIFDLESYVYTFLDCIAFEFFDLLNLEFNPSNSDCDQNLTFAKEFIKFRSESISEIVYNSDPKQLASIRCNKKLLNIFRLLYKEIKNVKPSFSLNLIHDSFISILLDQANRK